MCCICNGLAVLTKSEHSKVSVRVLELGKTSSLTRRMRPRFDEAVFVIDDLRDFNVREEFLEFRHEITRVRRWTRESID